MSAAWSLTRVITRSPAAKRASPTSTSWVPSLPSWRRSSRAISFSHTTSALLGDHHRVHVALVGLVPVADPRLAAPLGVGGDRDPVLGHVEVQGLHLPPLP